MDGWKYAIVHFKLDYMIAGGEVWGWFVYSQPVRQGPVRDLDVILNEYASRGWELVTLATAEQDGNGKVTIYRAVFKRPA